MVDLVQSARDYIEYFTPEERICSLMVEPVKCKIIKCKNVVGFTDILNYYDHVKYRCLEHSKYQKIIIQCALCGANLGSSERLENTNLVGVICKKCKDTNYTNKLDKWDKFKEMHRQ